MVQGKDFTLGFPFLKKNVPLLFILLAEAIVNLRKKKKNLKKENIRKYKVGL